MRMFPTLRTQIKSQPSGNTPFREQVVGHAQRIQGQLSQNPQKVQKGLERIEGRQPPEDEVQALAGHGTQRGDGNQRDAEAVAGTAGTSTGPGEGIPGLARRRASHSSPPSSPEDAYKVGDKPPKFEENQLNPGKAGMLEPSSPSSSSPSSGKSRVGGAKSAMKEAFGRTKHRMVGDNAKTDVVPA